MSSTAPTTARVRAGAGGPRGDPAAGIIVLVAGLLCVAAGVVVIAGWFCRSTDLLRWPGSDNPMVLSAALALAVTGAALATLSRGWHQLILPAAALDVALSTLVLVGRTTGRALGLDDLFVTAYLSGPPDSGGRMSMNTAVCFVLVAAGLLAFAPWWPWPASRAAVSAGAGSLIAAIAMLSLLGHAAGLSAAYGWGDEVSMAVLTGAAMLVIAVGLLVLTWLRSDRAGQWLAMPAAALMLGAAVLVWLAFTGTQDPSGLMNGPSTIRAVTILGLVTAALVAFAVWMALRAEHARMLAAAGESRLFQFLDALPVGVSIRSAGGRAYYANDEAQRVLGPISPETVEGGIPEAYQAYAEDTGLIYPHQETAHAKASRGERAHFDDMEIRRPDGSVIALEVWGRPIYGPTGSVDYTIAAFTDISDRRAAQRSLSDQASLLDLANDAIFVWDAEHKISFWNRGAEHTYGFTQDEAIGRVPCELLRTEYPALLADIEAELDASGSWQGELVQGRRDGQRIVLASRWAGRRAAPDGARVATMEVNRDITADRNAERYARSLIEASQDPLVTISPAGKITDVNQATIRATEAQRDLLIGTDVADFFTEPDRARAAYRQVFADGFIVDRPLAIRRKNGEVRDVLANASLYRDAGGAVLGIVATVHDITYRKRAEQEGARRAVELERANAALARSNAELEQFAYVASHDLSEPLRAISRPLSLVARRYQGQLDEQADEFIGFAVDGCERMQSLIDGLLAFSRVGRLQDDFVPIAAEKTVNGVLNALGPSLHDTHATVTVAPLPVVLAEPTQLTQVFQNLITNAVKFTSPDVDPQISVSAAPCGTGWRFTVSDNGIGIDPRHRERVFGMFKRLHGSDEYPGTGIGLALVKKIVERHGGQVGIDDTTAGTGSRVWFTLPAAAGTHP